MTRVYSAYKWGMPERDIVFRTNIKDARYEQCHWVSTNNPYVSIYETTTDEMNEPGWFNMLTPIGDIFVDTDRRGRRTYVYEWFYDGSIRTVHANGNLGVYLKKPRRR